MRSEELSKTEPYTPSIEPMEGLKNNSAAMPSFDPVNLFRSAEISKGAGSVLPPGLAKDDLLLAQLEPYQVRGYVKDALGHLDDGHPSAMILRKMLEEDQKQVPWRARVSPTRVPDVW
jgi:hypothetical protein